MSSATATSRPIVRLGVLGLALAGATLALGASSCASTCPAQSPSCGAGAVSSNATTTTTAPSASPSAATSASALALQTTVAGDGPPLAIMGGGVGGVKGWEPIAARLAKDHHTVVRAQHLAVQYGLEDRPLPTGYSIRLEAAALGAALDRLGMTGPIDIVGHSSGALIVMTFALDHPGRVRTLTLSEPPAYFLLDDKQKALPETVEWAGFLRKIPPNGEITDADVEGFMRLLGALPPGKPGKDSPRWGMFVEHRRSMRGFPAIVADDDQPARLDAFKRPVLLVRGEGTVPVHAMINEQLKRHFPTAQTIEFPGGHNAVLAAGDKFVDALEKFLGAAP